ncbi:MAG TPA: DUF3224 domain-containing protein [Amycolatopsis sp.]|nr:DUF3224 domain-containing protein [Amycolatopsis sp.]
MNTFSMKNWDEHIAAGAEGGPRVAYAHAAMAYTGVIDGESTCDYLLYYAGDGFDGDGQTAPGFERFEAKIDGREGTFVIRHECAFDEKGISSTFTVVPGSGTGELAGIEGSGTVAGAMGEQNMNYTFDYRL